MAQWTVALDPSLGSQCEVRVRTSAVDARGKPLYATMVLRNGETVCSVDPSVIAFFDAMRQAGNTRVFTTLATRPPTPTHDVDVKTREPLPEDTRTASAKGGTR